MKDIYDIIIVGGGPAGITAALYSARAGKSTLLIERMFLGGQVAVTPKVKNYPGGISDSGMEIAKAMEEQLKGTDAEIINGQVTGFGKDGKIHTVAAGNTEYRARCLILAMGAPAKKLGIRGEEEFAGAGVSYCAVCDGNFFRNKTVAVIGGSNNAFDDALYLSDIADKVYLVHCSSNFRALDVFRERADNKENIEYIVPYKAEEITGDRFVKGLLLKNAETGEDRLLECDGVFVALGSAGNTSVIPEGIETDKDGFIISGEGCGTSAEGVFAAGDIRKKTLRQIVTATADGANAVSSALEYLSSIRK